MISFSMAFSILLVFLMMILWSQLESVICLQFFMSVIPLSLLGMSLSSDVLCYGGRLLVVML